MPKTQGDWLDWITRRLRSDVTPDTVSPGTPQLVTDLLRCGSLYDVPKLAELLQQSLPPKIAVDALPAIALTAHRNGRIRERAVQDLAAQADAGMPVGFGPIELGLLLLRLNDWVPQVRLAAEALLSHLRPTLPAHDLATTLPLLLNPDLWYRPSTEGRALIDGIVADPAIVAAALTNLRDDGSNDAARLIRATIMHERFDAGLDDLALHARHPGVRDIAFRALLGSGNGIMTFDIGRRRIQRPTALKPDRANLLARGMASRSPSVRYRAVQAFGETLTPSAAGLHLARTLLDPARQVAEVAAFWIAHHGGDPRATLLAHVRSGRDVKSHHCALLAKYGVRADHEALLARAATSRGKLKIAALEGAMTLLSAKPTELEAIAFTGPLPDAAIAARRLVSAGHAIAADQLIAAASADPRGFMARKLWRLLKAHTPMVRLAVAAKLGTALSETELEVVAGPLPRQLRYPPADEATTHRIKADAQRIDWLWARVAIWFW